MVEDYQILFQYMLSVIVAVTPHLFPLMNTISFVQGYFLLFESMLDTVLYARDKWLKDRSYGEWYHLQSLILHPADIKDGFHFIYTFSITSKIGDFTWEGAESFFLYGMSNTASILC